VPFPPDRTQSRRALLRAGLIGGAGAAGATLIGCTTEHTGETREASVARLPGDQVYAFNDGWLFGGEFRPNSERRGFDDSHFERVTLPHTVAPLSWHDWDPRSWERVWIYRRHFDAAGLPARTRVIAEFDGVMVDGMAVLNDHPVATHLGGYLPWTAELTNHLTRDDNVLAVMVDARAVAVPPTANGLGAGSIDFLQPGGIYRDVRLLVVPQVYLSDVFALPRDVLFAPALDVQCTIDAAERLAEPATLTVTLLDGSTPVASAQATVDVRAPGRLTTRLTLSGLGGITLWHTDAPKLYTVEATLTSTAGTHTRTRRTGFREASFTTEGFFLNGKRLKIFGLDRHQLYPYFGMAAPERLQRRDAEILSSDLNCNMVRCSHYPQSPHFLDACDELGLMVWQEAPGWHFIGDQTWQDVVVQNVRDMVLRDRWRPSVIIWGTRLNESLDHPDLYRRTRQAARELDASRPSSGAMNIHSTKHWAEDVFAYDDYNHVPGQVKLLHPLPGVPYLISESVGVLGLHPRRFRWNDPPAWLASQAVMHAQAHAQAAANDRYCGLLAWCAFDYGSMLAPGTDNLKTPGVADTFRVPKPGAAIYQAQTDPAVRPVIIPVPAWDFHAAPPPRDRPGPNLMIATNCDRVEVRIAGTPAVVSAAADRGPRGRYAQLAYPPVFVHLTADHPGPISELRITGFLGRKPVTEVRISSDPLGFRLAMAADDDEIDADGSDATRVVFRAVDAHGNPVRYSHGDVTLRLSGPGRIVGDHPFPLGAYGGHGGVWVRSLSGRPGTITLTAEHPELGSAQVTISTTTVNSRSISLA
jgi:beta-galactosidase